MKAVGGPKEISRPPSGEYVIVYPSFYVGKCLIYLSSLRKDILESPEGVRNNIRVDNFCSRVPGGIFDKGISFNIYFSEPFLKDSAPFLTRVVAEIVSFHIRRVLSDFRELEEGLE